MEKPARAELMKLIGAAKLRVQAMPGFIEDPELRAFYVVLCTLEGSMMFGDLPDFASLCAKFCEDKAGESRN